MSKIRLPEICLAVCLLGMLPLLTLHAFQLWGRTHFQFFPLAWLGFAWFAWNGSGPIADAKSSWRVLAGRMAWAAGLAACVLAVLLFSPWVANVACLLCIFGWGLLRLGELAWSRWTAWQALLWCALPLPGNYDAALIGKLQSLSSSSTSAILDMFGVLHLQQGNVLEIRSRKLFVDEACSGVDSLYALAAMSIFILLLQKKPLLVSLLSFVTVPLWAWLGNVLRLTSITLLLEFAKVDFSSGWKHSVLGLVIFALMASFFALALAGLSHLFRRFSTASLPDKNRQWHLIYNGIACYPQPAPVLVTEQDRYFTDHKSSIELNDANSVRLRLGFVNNPWVKRTVTATCMVVGLASLGLSLLLVYRHDDLQSALALPNFPESQIDRAISEDSLPNELLNLKRVRFKSELRHREDILGNHSRTWQYEDRVDTYLLSLDFPFRGFHALWTCYVTTGSKILSQSSRELTVDSLSVELHGVELQDGTGGLSYLYFTNFDKNGEPVRYMPESNIKELLITRILRPSPANYKLPPVAFQCQLFVNAGRVLTDAEKQRYESIFLEALPRMVEAVQRLNQTQ